VDPARSRETGGTGLGLSIVKHVTADHGGEVTVWSEPGRGSTFTLRLPAATLPPEGLGEGAVPTRRSAETVVSRVGSAADVVLDAPADDGAPARPAPDEESA